MFYFLTDTTGTGGMGLSTILMLVAMLAVFYFMMIRPENKRKKEAEQMRSETKVGDEIVSIGGICGKVVHIKDEKVIIETSADQVRIELTKWAISSNETGAQRAREAAQKAAEAKAKAMAEKKAAKGK